MTTPSLTVEQAIGQLRLTDEQLRIWRKVTLVLGFRNVGKALSAIAPRKGAVKGIVEAQVADSEPTAVYVAKVEATAAAIEEPEVRAEYIADCTADLLPNPMTHLPEWWVRDTSLQISVAAFTPCADHADLAYEFRVLLNSVADLPKADRKLTLSTVSYNIEHHLPQCEACRSATNIIAREEAIRRVDSRKLPGIGYRGGKGFGYGAFNRHLPHNKVGGEIAPNPGGYERQWGDLVGVGVTRWDGESRRPYAVIRAMDDDELAAS